MPVERVKTRTPATSAARGYTCAVMSDGVAGSLYFSPPEKVPDEQARRWLREGPPQKRLWVISCLLRYAQWNDIWTYVTRDEVRDCFAELDLPPHLRRGGGGLLKSEPPVG